MLKKAVICIALAALVAAFPVTATAETVSGFNYNSSTFYDAEVWVENEFLYTFAEFENGRGFATYMSRNTYGTFQFGNLWDAETRTSNPGGDLLGYVARFRLNGGGADTGDKLFYSASVWLKYAGENVSIGLVAVDADGVTLGGFTPSISSAGKTYELYYSGLYTYEKAEHFELVIRVSGITGVGNVNDLTFTFSQETMFVAGAALDFAQLEQQRQTNEKLTEINKEQIETNEKLDQLLEQPEKEKQEADSTGNSAADGVMDAIPGDTAGFSEGIKKFAAALSYSGTECEWTLPAITLPAIPGVMPKMQLTGDLPINFSEWVQKIPGNVLEVVQLVLTVALVVYCFKELYSTISYFLTLKGGSKE